MFIFESFTYDDNWASQYYDNFYNSSNYIKEYLNNGYTGNGEFTVNKCYSKDHENYRYKISYLNKSNIFDNRFPYKAYLYAYNKLKNFGDAITVDPGCFPDKKDSDEHCDIIIRYDKEKDENRWDSEHIRYENAFKSDEVLSCLPTFEQWLYMIQAKFEKKNPSRFLSKEKNLKSAAAKYIVSIKLNWNEAEKVLEEILSKLLVNEIYAKYSDKFPSFIKILNAYAKFKYEIDPAIQNLLDDIKSIDKHVGDIQIPKKYYKIAKQLDNNQYVKKYQYLGKYDDAFDIQTINDNIGRIAIDTDEQLGNDFFKMRLHLKGTHYYDDKKSHSYKFNALSSIIPSVVNAIYKNDPNELDKIIIKIS